MATKPKKKTRKFVNKKSYGKSLSFRAPPALLATLKAATKREGLAMGTLLRLIAQDYIERAYTTPTASAALLTT